MIDGSCDELTHSFFCLELICSYIASLLMCLVESVLLFLHVVFAVFLSSAVAADLGRLRQLESIANAFTRLTLAHKGEVHVVMTTVIEVGECLVRCIVTLESSGNSTYAIGFFVSIDRGMARQG